MTTLPWLADALRSAGVTVVEHDGWREHYRPGDWSPRFGVVHATAAPTTQSDAGQIAVVRNGRSDLPGPIALAVVDHLGRWHVVSAGRCNTTLVGTAGPYAGLGNTYALGVEACNNNRDEPWPAPQYAAYARGWAAICHRLGWTAGHLVAHKEHTPGHKTDPTFNMDAFRRLVSVHLAQLAGDRPPAPRPPAPSSPPALTMTERTVKALPTLTPGDTDHAAVERAQALLNTYGYRLTEDGVYGPATGHAVKTFQTRHGLDDDGVIGQLTWAKLLGV